MFSLIIDLALLTGIVAGGLILLRSLFLLVTIVGDSMVPTLLPQDRVLVLKRGIVGKVKKGTIVLLKEPMTGFSSHSLVVKRVVAVEGEIFSPGDSGLSTPSLQEEQQMKMPIPSRQVFVCGDNRTSSYDSRQWGPVPLSSIQGMVIYRFKRRTQLAPPGECFNLSFLSGGQQAPNFTVLDISGTSRTLYEMRGHQVLLLFIAYRQLVRQALPTLLTQAATISGRGMTVWIICDEVRERAQSMQEEFQIPFPVLAVPRSHSSIYADYHIFGTPCYYLIDERGNVADAGIPNIVVSGWRQLCTVMR